MSEDELVSCVTDCVDQALHTHHFKINYAAYQNLLVHISIAVMRAQSGHYAPLADNVLEEIKDTQGFPVAQTIAGLIQRSVDVSLPEEEVAYIALHLSGKQVLPSNDAKAEHTVVTDEVWDQVSEILERIWDVYRFDFRHDFELRMNLARHIVPLSIRLRCNMSLSNPLLSDIKSRYPLAFAMAQDASTVLADHYQVPLSEDEIGYIALEFALALERLKAEAPKKNILIVSAESAGSARLLEYRCRQEFGAYVGKILTVSVSDLDQFDFTDIDYVLTTVPLERALPVPVCQITGLLDEADVEEIKETLRVPKDGHPCTVREQVHGHTTERPSDTS